MSHLYFQSSPVIQCFNTERRARLEIWWNLPFSFSPRLCANNIFIIKLCSHSQPKMIESLQRIMFGVNRTAFVFRRSNRTVPTTCPCVTSRQDVCICVGGEWTMGESWMSDREEHLSEAKTSGQLMHYSQNGGMRRVRAYVGVCVCVLTDSCLCEFCGSQSSEMWAKDLWLRWLRKQVAVLTATWHVHITHKASRERAVDTY